MIGTRLGRWMIEAQIGRGAMGTVWRARAVAEAPAEFAAVKILAHDRARDPIFLQRFQREIEALREFDHPHIVRLFEFGVIESSPYSIMEYVPGPDGDRLVRELGPRPWPEVLEVAAQVTSALKHAHDRGIIHRDLKPANLLFKQATASSEARQEEAGDQLPASEGLAAGPASVFVKLSDFSVARVLAGATLSEPGQLLGTAEYLAPEQAAGKPATKRSDLYALGGVLFTLLTGRPPFTGTSLAELVHKHVHTQPERASRLVDDLPHDLDELIARLLSKDPDARPGDAGELFREIDRIRRKLHRQGKIPEPVPVAPAGPAVVWPEPTAEPRSPASLAARLFNNPIALGLLLAGVIALIVWGLTRNRVDTVALWEQAQPQLASAKGPADLRRIWAEYLGPIREHDPDFHRDEIDAIRHRMDNETVLAKAIETGEGLSAEQGPAKKFYLKGLRLCQAGDLAGARRTWTNVVHAFTGVSDEADWVRLAELGLAHLGTPPTAPAAAAPAVRAALKVARDRKQAGKLSEAETILSGLEELYKNDPAGTGVLEQVRRIRAGE